ncbi:MAG: hypothetical protein ACI9MR_000053, partial [Myxococcota bacterium]
FSFDAGVSAPMRPTAWYRSLWPTSPTDLETGAELSGLAYARASVTYTVTGNVATPVADTDFTAASGTWASVTHGGVHTASTGTGNGLVFASSSPATVATSGDTFRVTATTSLISHA